MKGFVGIFSAFSLIFFRYAQVVRSKGRAGHTNALKADSKKNP